MKPNESELDASQAVNEAITNKRKWIKPDVEIISSDIIHSGTARYYAEGMITPNIGLIGAS